MNQDITTLRAFRRQILQYYRAHKRDFPWRRTDNPYHILISEVMLQQTQAPRVVAKYNEFITTFPTIQALAKAPIEKLLRVWQGLGYNRRALALRKLAQIAAAEHGGTLPNDYEQLLALPGVGQSTAGAVLAFGYNNPMPFIETNIRRVYLHFFFPERDQVSDRQLLPLIKATLDRSQARRWYFALMDYGAMLAHETPINPNRRSRSYHRQSRFEGSHRQLRGQLLKTLLTQKSVTNIQIAKHIKKEAVQVHEALRELEQEGFISRRGSHYSLLTT